MKYLETKPVWPELSSGILHHDVENMAEDETTLLPSPPFLHPTFHPGPLDRLDSSNFSRNLTKIWEEFHLLPIPDSPCPLHSLPGERIVSHYCILRVVFRPGWKPIVEIRHGSFLPGLLRFRLCRKMHPGLEAGWDEGACRTLVRIRGDVGKKVSNSCQGTTNPGLWHPHLLRIYGIGRTRSPRTG